MMSTLVAKYRDYVLYRQTRTELERLSTRDLDDLGIARRDIPALARRHAVR